MLTVSSSDPIGIESHHEGTLVLSRPGLISCPKPQPKTAIISSALLSSHHDDLLAFLETSLSLTSVSLVAKSLKSHPCNRNPNTDQSVLTLLRLTAFRSAAMSFK